MNTGECFLLIQQIWGNLKVPTGNLVKYQGKWPEAEVEVFKGKKFDEVNLNPASHDCFALNYFNPEARFYYLGSYLIFTIKWAEDVTNGTKFAFWDQRIFLAMDILESEIREIEKLDYSKHDLNALQRLVEIYRFIESLT